MPRIAPTIESVESESIVLSRSESVATRPLESEATPPNRLSSRPILRATVPPSSAGGGIAGTSLLPLPRLPKSLSTTIVSASASTPSSTLSTRAASIPSSSSSSTPSSPHPTHPILLEHTPHELLSSSVVLGVADLTLLDCTHGTQNPEQRKKGASKLVDLTVQLVLANDNSSLSSLSSPAEVHIGGKVDSRKSFSNASFAQHYRRGPYAVVPLSPHTSLLIEELKRGREAKFLAMSVDALNGHAGQSGGGAVAAVTAHASSSSSSSSKKRGQQAAVVAAPHSAATPSKRARHPLLAFASGTVYRLTALTRKSSSLSSDDVAPAPIAVQWHASSKLVDCTASLVVQSSSSVTSMPSSNVIVSMPPLSPGLASRPCSTTASSSLSASPSTRSLSSISSSASLPHVSSPPSSPISTCSASASLATSPSLSPLSSPALSAATRPIASRKRRSRDPVVAPAVVVAHVPAAAAVAAAPVQAQVLSHAQSMAYPIANDDAAYAALPQAQSYMPYYSYDAQAAVPVAAPLPYDATMLPPYDATLDASSMFAHHAWAPAPVDAAYSFAPHEVDATASASWSWASSDVNSVASSASLSYASSTMSPISDFTDSESECSLEDASSSSRAAKRARFDAGSTYVHAHASHDEDVRDDVAAASSAAAIVAAMTVTAATAAAAVAPLPTSSMTLDGHDDGSGNVDDLLMFPMPLSPCVLQGMGGAPSLLTTFSSLAHDEPSLWSSAAGPSSSSSYFPPTSPLHLACTASHSPLLMSGLPASSSSVLSSSSLSSFDELSFVLM